MSPAVDSSLVWSVVSGVGILVFAATQAWIAYRKLSLDLFDRRFDCYQALNDALNDRLTEIGAIGTGAEENFDAKALHAVWAARQRMRLLFPRRVSKQLELVEIDLRDLAILKAGLAGSHYTAEEKKAFMGAVRAYQKGEQTLVASRERLGHLVTPLMIQFGLGPTFFTGLFQKT